MTIESEALHTIKLAYGIKAHVVPDPAPQSPSEWDNIGEITTHGLRMRHFGSDVSGEAFAEIGTEVDIGIFCRMDDYGARGMRLVEVGDTERANVIFHCTNETAIAEFGTETDKLAAALDAGAGLTEACNGKVLACLRNQMEAWNQYFEGDVYGIVVQDRDGNDLESCWGFYGYDYAKEEAGDMGKWEVKAERKRRAEKKRRSIFEANERAYWNARGVVTVGA